MLELLMLSLELLCLLQGAGGDQTSVQHGLSITDPTQNLGGGRESERVRDRQTDRQTDRQRETIVPLSVVLVGASNSNL